MGIADEIAANQAKRRDVNAAAAALNAEMFELVTRGYNEGISVPDLAQLAHVTRGRIYQILRGE